MKPLILAIMTTATLAGCGADKEERNETPGGDNQDTVKTVVADEETSSQVITAQVDDAISAAGEDQESESAAGLMLANADTKKIHKYTHLLKYNHVRLSNSFSNYMKPQNTYAVNDF